MQEGYEESSDEDYTHSFLKSIQDQDSKDGEEHLKKKARLGWGDDLVRKGLAAQV